MSHTHQEPQEIQSGELLAYALGTISQAEAVNVEAALMSSQETLAAYLAIKRSLLPQEATPARPSPSARARLREAVAQKYSPPWYSRALDWLTRPIPFYQGLAAAGVAMLLAALLWIYWPVSQPNTKSPMIDAASHGAEQLNWS